ncbi:MAG TPA: PIN domain-containing protein [Thermoanaerobaculia bacterium]|nr:PIN domain-containing protein [Thermoanaerobaculia bacterium]
MKRSTIAVRFVDTNVLLYAVSTAPRERSKNERALAILDDHDLAVSVQVLQEFYVQATRSSRSDPLTHQQATALVESWLRFRVQETTIDLLRNALSTKERWNLSYWDAAVVEGARLAGCRILLTEDLQHGADFAGVRVENPFR